MLSFQSRVRRPRCRYTFSFFIAQFPRGIPRVHRVDHRLQISIFFKFLKIKQHADFFLQNMLLLSPPVLAPKREQEQIYASVLIYESGKKMAAIPNVFSVIQSESDSGAGFQYPDHLSGIFYHKAPAIVQKNPGMLVWSGAIAKAPQYFRFQGFATSGGTIGCHQAPLLGRSSTFPRSHCRRSPGL